MVVPVEYTPAVTAMTVGDHYSAHITQPQMYTVATTVNGASYIQASYPLASVYVSAKDYLKMINGAIEGMDTSPVGANMTPSADTMMDACIPNPAGGMVVPSNIYPAPWTSLYPCPQYVLPHHMPTFLTPIAPVHPSGMRTPVPNAPVSVRAATVEAIPSTSLPASPYVAMATLPQAPVATLSATPVAVTLTPAIPTPMSLVNVPPQGGMVSAVIAQEVGVNTASICQDSMDCSDAVPSCEYEVESVTMMNVELDQQEDIDDGQQCNVSEDKSEYDNEPEATISQSYVPISDPEHCDETTHVLPTTNSDVSEQEEQYETLEVSPSGEQQDGPCKVTESSPVVPTGSWGTPKSWASLFKKEDTSASPSTLVVMKSHASKPSVATDEQSSSPLTSSVETQQSAISPTDNQFQSTGALMEEPPKCQRSNGLTGDDQDDIHILGGEWPSTVHCLVKSLAVIKAK